MSNGEKRALFLFDGPNFYRNLKDAQLDRGHLDFRRLAETLAGPRTIVGVLFFTSPVDRQTEPENAAGQQRFFAKLRASGVILRLGNLVSRKRRCSACEAESYFKVEKSLDVQIAMELVLGCAEDRYDAVYLASCDSDLVPAIRYVRSKGKDVFLLWPEGSKCHAASSACRVTIPIKQATLDAAQSCI
ncbi:NYN domain-containing protein [Desulfocurvus sp.]|uniref:NYN domain-containing protein n=1 Tax=Desulfocurvus sp. TaxID=2871698 RepID=UPI0025C3C6F8|nr:NYN domain-containing protein [Desulfocurvus sp.]MCK9239646.1 NYN domain-containing protein [Desulfocurvus sp.]